MTTNLPPTTAACVIATAIVAGVTGYFIGQGASLGLFSSSSSSSKQNKHAAPKITPHDGDASDEEEEEYDESGSESESDADGGELASFKDNSEEVKLVLVVRTDLGMTKGGIIPNCLLFFSRVAEALTDVPPPSTGKIAAQCSHATLACYKYFLSHAPDSPILRRWERGGQAKIALQIKSEEDLLLLQAQAMSLGLCARVIQDAGRTQIASGSRTVLGVLGPRSIVDSVTGHLKLL